ncbi:MAG TPA: hypothetical protein VEB21_19895 [Terriglobales bacterium]|nr:hypothetical protein [Terriglobales bacterium]
MFPSFFLAGFECATGYNMHGDWIDQVAATRHDVLIASDYDRLRAVGIRAARDGVRWPLVDCDGRWDLASVVQLIDASQKAGVNVIYDLFHFGYPAHVDLFDADMPRRFADYCHAVARCVARYADPPHFFSPVNEPSYFAWAAAEVGRFAPHAHGRGWELKVALARAAIAGTNAIWTELPGARMVSVDALCHVVAPLEDGVERAAEVADFNDRLVFQCWDMITGRLLPELGGSAAHLGVVGVNYYWTNQWEIDRAERPLAQDDPRLVPLHRLLERVWRRYGAEIVITETSHVGDLRAGWVEYLGEQADLAFARGIPLRGICLYPILGMPEWHVRDQWVPMGLWDIDTATPSAHRRLYQPMLAALRRIQRLEGRQYLSSAVAAKVMAAAAL